MREAGAGGQGLGEPPQPGRSDVALVEHVHHGAQRTQLKHLQHTRRFHICSNETMTICIDSHTLSQ